MFVVEKIRFCSEWLRRLGKRRGFGIQSPSAYRFVTEVLCQPSPYYAYEELSARFPGLSGRHRRLCRLLFRLSNDCQAAKTYVSPSLSEEARAHLQAGNRRTSVSGVADGCGLAVVSAADVEDFPQFQETLPEGAVLVLVGHLRKGAPASLWREIMSCERVGMTFDAYDVGVAVFSRNLHRNHYAVNL